MKLGMVCLSSQYSRLSSLSLKVFIPNAVLTRENELSPSVLTVEGYMFLENSSGPCPKYSDTPVTIFALSSSEAVLASKLLRANVMTVRPATVHIPPIMPMRFILYFTLGGNSPRNNI